MMLPVTHNKMIMIIKFSIVYFPVAYSLAIVPLKAYSLFKFFLALFIKTATMETKIATTARPASAALRSREEGAVKSVPIV